MLTAPPPPNQSKYTTPDHVSVKDDRFDNHPERMGQEEGACQSDGRQFYSPASQIGSKDRSVAWYDKTLSGVPADARDLLERYSKVPPDEVEPHVLSMVGG